MRTALTLPDTEEDLEDIETVETRVGEVVLTDTDGLKEFMLHFEKYLQAYTLLKDSSAGAQRRMVNDVLSYMLDQEYVTTLTAPTICKLFRNMDDLDPEGFLQRKKDAFSSNYKRKIVEACRRAVYCLENQQEVYQLDEKEKIETVKRLDSLRSRCYIHC